MNNITSITKYNWFWQSLILLSIVGVNLGISALIRNFGFYYVPNEYPFGFNIGLISSALIIVFVTWGMFALDLFSKSPSFTLLILAGGWSNFLERIIFGSATDYIMFVASFINLADLQIWIGLILLNAQIWFWKPSNKEKG
jgi:lipoprotein signal peptidase